MKKYILFLLLFASFNLFPASYPNAVYDMYNILYSQSENNINTSAMNAAIKKVEALKGNSVEEQTYKNLLVVIKLGRYDKKDKKLKKKNTEILKNIIKENTPYKSETDANYLASLATVNIYLMPYVGLGDIIELGKEAEKLYDKALEVDPSNFNAITGKANSMAYKPSFVGGGIDKALPLLIKAENNAQEPYQKYLTYIWLSQAYFELKNYDQYIIYIEKAKNIFPNGSLLIASEKLNNKKKSLYKPK